MDSEVGAQLPDQIRPHSPWSTHCEDPGTQGGGWQQGQGEERQGRGRAVSTGQREEVPGLSWLCHGLGGGERAEVMGHAMF